MTMFLDEAILKKLAEGEGLEPTSHYRNQLIFHEKFLVEMPLGTVWGHTF